MNIFRLAFELFLLYLAYKFIFGFVIPLYQATKQMNNKMNNLQQKMREQEQAMRQQTQARPTAPTNTRPKNEEYIDYEEIK